MEMRGSEENPQADIADKLNRQKFPLRFFIKFSLFSQNKVGSSGHLLWRLDNLTYAIRLKHDYHIQQVE